LIVVRHRKYGSREHLDSFYNNAPKPR
jgi:hypothetical protein